jgi:YYY domain-containing protein
VIPPGPGNEITEFPLFTLLYSDLHAHMLVMPLTLFIIAWAVSFIKSRAQMSRTEWIATFGIGALMIGALKPTNTWDLYTFFPFAALAVIYAINRHYEWKDRFHLPDWLGRALFSIAFVIGLYLLGSLMYSPFDHWYSQAYNKVDPWLASRTPFSSYFTHWGLFLFIITAWLLWEVREWMAATPVSHLKKLSGYQLLIEIGLAAVLALFGFFILEGVRISLVALPLAVLAGLLLLRPDMPGVKRAVLLMIGTGLALTLAVEVITLRGDIGRMNTIFKLYMQVWILFAVSTAAAFGWLLEAFPNWTLRWRTIYQTGLYLLLAGAFLFTVTATTDKISDRITDVTPHTLDGMTYMDYALHPDGGMMDLSEDYRAIRWMQDNVQGSPVIVEANCTEYRWCTRFTIYTGLPGVIGWNWHQRQQRGFAAPTAITDRVSEIGMFYTTQDVQWTRTFLKKYMVKYFVVGQLERNIYPAFDPAADGLSKFEKYDGKYWKKVYHDKNTTIYEVLP